MLADYIHKRASYGKRSFSALYTPIFRSGDSKRRWEALLVTALYILTLGLSQFLEPGATYAKESQVELGPYEVIISKDPFDPERGKSQLLTSVAESDLKERCQVYGIIIIGEMRKAFLMITTSESASGPRKKVARGSQKASRTVSVGDLVDGWRVEDITAQGVKFESDGKYVEVGIFSEVKKERKATAPVALQTPQPKPKVIRAPQSTPAKMPSTSKPASPSPKKPRKRILKPLKTRSSTKSQEITKEAGGGKQLNVVIPPAAPSGNPFLELIKEAKEG